MRALFVKLEVTNRQFLASTEIQNKCFHFICLDFVRTPASCNKYKRHRANELNSLQYKASEYSHAREYKILDNKDKFRLFWKLRMVSPSFN